MFIRISGEGDDVVIVNLAEISTVSFFDGEGEITLNNGSVFTTGKTGVTRLWDKMKEYNLIMKNYFSNFKQYEK